MIWKALLFRDIPDNCKHSPQYFCLLSEYAQTGPSHCMQLFQLGAFEASIRFLLGKFLFFPPPT